MTSNTVALIIAGGGFLLSIVTTLMIIAIAYGSLREQVRELQSERSRLVTKDDLAPIKESLAEIRGMFRLELKEK